ncbi:MAG: arnT 2 [Gammaproteobacteria bacterium]|jgi:4-amino-4-deoxy-L-arabinose transferase-like glycosyltransferase|nr:arnT 2 [Gammaproteobacteria bacterium]
MIRTYKTWFYDLLWLILLIGGLYSLFLASRFLAVPDEARYVEIPREMLETGDFITPHLNYIKYLEKPPLFYWLQAGAIKLFGYNLWAWRLPTAILAILGCLMTYVTGRALYNRTTAWFSSIILASSLLYFIMGHYVTLDMAVSVFISATLLSFILAMQFPAGRLRRYLLWSMYFFAALALLTKGLIGIALPGLVIFAWLLINNEWRQLKRFYWFSGIGLFLVIALPWHLLMQLNNPEFFHYYIIEQHILRYTTLLAKHYQPAWWFLLILLLGFFPWTGLLFQALCQRLIKNWRGLKQDKITLYLLLWFGLILGFYSFSNSKLIPYILPIWPAMALLTGHYLTEQLSKTINRGIKINWLIIIATSILLAIGLMVFAEHFSAKLPSNIPVNSLYYLAIGFILNAVINSFFYYHRKLISLVVSCALTHMLIFSTALLWLPKLDDRYTKPLADIIQPLLTKDVEVIGYYHYYQDLPVYLQKQLTVVNTQEELADGMRYQDASAWMIDSVELKKRWQNPSRIFLITNKKNLARLQIENLWPFHILGQTNRDVLISNKP